MDRIDQICEKLRELQGQCTSGFAVALHIRFTTPRFLFQTYSQAWSKVYSERGLVMHDPTVRWGLENVGMIDWSELSLQDPGDVIGQARSHGILHGVTMSIFEDDSRSVGSYSRGDRGFTDTEIAFLHDSFLHLHHETASLGDKDADLNEALKRLSVELTHGQEADRGWCQTDENSSLQG